MTPGLANGCQLEQIVYALDAYSGEFTAPAWTPVGTAVSNLERGHMLPAVTTRRIPRGGR